MLLVFKYPRFNKFKEEIFIMDLQKMIKQANSLKEELENIRETVRGTSRERVLRQLYNSDTFEYLVEVAKTSTSPKELLWLSGFVDDADEDDAVELALALSLNTFSNSKVLINVFSSIVNKRFYYEHKKEITRIEKYSWLIQNCLVIEKCITLHPSAPEMILETQIRNSKYEKFGLTLSSFLFEYMDVSTYRTVWKMVVASNGDVLKSIYILDLSEKTRKLLEDANYLTILDLLLATDEELSDIRGIGTKRFIQIRKELSFYIDLNINNWTDTDEFSEFAKFFD